MDQGQLTWQPERLTCERFVDTALIGTSEPHLSWRVPAQAGDEAVAASELRVAALAEDLDAPNAWRSGWLEGVTGQWRYRGPSLSSRDVRWWSVRVRSASGAASQWSEPARFEVGLLERSDWVASWITRPRPTGNSRATFLLRRRFELTAPVVAARAYLSALGVTRAHLNGAPVGNGLLRPGWTDYRRRVQYDRIELADHLRVGDNVLVVELAPGWYAGRIADHAASDSAVAAALPELLAQIELETASGERLIVPSDERWEWAPSPIASSDLYDGEDWDLRLADPSFSEASSALLWEPVERSTGTAAALVAPRAAPLEVIARSAVTSQARADGTVLLDSGKNDTGYLELVVAESAGRKIEVHYAEVLDPAGNLHRANLRGARCVDTFVCKGDGEELLSPAFSYRGYRYAEVRGLSAPDRLRAAHAVSVASALQRTGWFRSGAPILERIYELMVCSLQANYVEVPTDCPQRDERMGWLADALLFAPVAAYTFDISAFMAKWFDDILDARTPEGAFPDIAPRPSARWPGRSFDPGAPAWSDAGILLPWLMYERYGDEEVLERMFPAMVEHLELIHHANPDGIWRHRRGKDYGDWVPAGPDTSHDLFATCWLYRSSAVVAEIAGHLGEHAIEQRFDAHARTVRDAFLANYVDADTGTVRDLEPVGSRAAATFAPVVERETQTGYVMALSLGLLEGEVANLAGERLAALVREAGGRLRTGFCGSAFLPAALERSGHAGLAYGLMLQDEPPSLGFMAKMGATSVWERWDGLDPNGWPACPTMNSFNHYAMSSMLSWLIEGVCGLRPVPGAPALSAIAFAPAVSRRVPSAGFRFEAPQGTVELGWEWQGNDRIHGWLRLPPGIRARIASVVAVDDDATGAATDAPATARDVGPGEHEVTWLLKA
ncbi:MAG: family 78 glycoside hydrolase catalytic domain [Actinomycetota bacterium]|nr:family 78 glycoside hydrolase catalytic domain [Actinomycetota bacterium]